MTLRLDILLLASTLIIVACADSSGGEPTPGGPATAVESSVGPGISVVEALVFRGEGPLLVRGWLWRAQGGDLRLCQGLTDSTPPQCTKPWLTVKGLDLGKVDLRTEGGVTWSPQPVLVLGDVAGGVLEVSALSNG